MRRQPGILFSYALPAATRIPIIILIIFTLVLVAGCTGTAPPRTPAAQAPVSEDPGTGSSWKEVPLTDLSGQGNFSIGMFTGKTVLVPVVSVSCPTCIAGLRKQQDEIVRLKQQYPGRIAIVSLDLDPETGPGFLAAYGDPANFTGYSARSPPDLTLSLLHRFGPFAIDTGTLPVILVCQDGHDLLLPAGLKTAESLNKTIAGEC
jgi:hypothetical protein